MTKRNWLAHPTVLLLFYLAVPVTLDVLTAAFFVNAPVASNFVALNAPGAVLVIQWGWAGMAFCVGLGLLLGVPTAAMQVAYLKNQIDELEAGASFDSVYRSWGFVVIMTAPWLLTVVAGHLLGSLVIFPPIGGPLIAFNPLWARIIVHPYYRAFLRYRSSADATAQATATVSV